MNWGSLESFPVSWRCGCRQKAPQMRRTVVADSPVWAAIERVDQWVASGGVLLQGGDDHPLDVGVADRARRPGARLVEQALQPGLDKAGAPLADRLGRHPDPLGHRQVAHALPRQEDHPRPPGRARSRSWCAGSSPRASARCSSLIDSGAFGRPDRHRPKPPTSLATRREGGDRINRGSAVDGHTIAGKPPVSRANRRGSARRRVSTLPGVPRRVSGAYAGSSAVSRGGGSISVAA